MATFETTRPAPFGAETTYHVVSFIDNMITALVARKSNRASRASMNHLSNDILNDIGLMRGDVDGSKPSFK